MSGTGIREQVDKLVLKYAGWVETSTVGWVDPPA